MKRRALISGFALGVLLAGSPVWPDPLEALIDSTTSSAVLPATAQPTIDLLQPDYDPSFLENLAAPVEPNAQVSLPEVVVKKNEWRGSQCGITQPHQLAFRNPKSWDAFWVKAMAPYSHRLKETPVIDFSKDMVVGVFLGEKPYPYYEIQILSTQFADATRGALVIRYRIIQKMMGIFTPPFAVQPFHLKKIPLFRGPVQFVQVKR